ncbi:MAG: hypothetical protein ACI4US_02595, partial [Muribaculaceae bacterium]
RAAAVAPPATPPMMMILMRWFVRVIDFDYTQPPDALHQECRLYVFRVFSTSKACPVFAVSGQ